MSLAQQTWFLLPLCKNSQGIYFWYSRILKMLPSCRKIGYQILIYDFSVKNELFCKNFIGIVKIILYSVKRRLVWVNALKNPNSINNYSKISPFQLRRMRSRLTPFGDQCAPWHRHLAAAEGVRPKISSKIRGLAPSPHPEVRTERKRAQRAERSEGRGLWGWRHFLNPLRKTTFYWRPNKTAWAIELIIFGATPGIL